MDFATKEIKAFSVTESIETRIYQIMEEEITTNKVYKVEADNSGSGPCGLEKSCDGGF